MSYLGKIWPDLRVAGVIESTTGETLNNTQGHCRLCIALFVRGLFFRLNISPKCSYSFLGISIFFNEKEQ